MSRGIEISSNNLNGELVNIVFTADTGSTITNFGDLTIPASLVTDYYYGQYNIYTYTYDANYTFSINQPVTGYGFNLIALPYNFPTSGNTIMTDNNSGIPSGTTNPNLFVGPGQDGIYWSSVDIDGINRDDYFSQFTGQSVTFTISQNGSTAIYSGDSNSFQSWSFTGGSGYVFGYGIQQEGYPSSGDTVLIQSATTQWVIGNPVYISAVINNPVTPTPTPTPTESSVPSVTPTPTPTPTASRTVSGDAIRDALTVSVDAYDAAEIGNFIQVTSEEYLSVIDSTSSSRFIMDDADATSTGPTSFSTEFNFAYPDSNNPLGIIEAGNYIIGYTYRAVHGQVASVTTYLRESNNPSGTYTKIGNDIIFDSVAENSNYYFIRKSPETATSEPSFVSFYASGPGSLITVNGKSNYPVYYSAGVDTNNWTLWTNDYPILQVIGTPTKQW
jgi:hypothetical protein